MSVNAGCASRGEFRAHPVYNCPAIGGCMDLVPIFRKVLLGAAESSLDIAGAAVLPPPAWPILKGALQPVLDRIKERLGGEVTGSPERAERAVSEFAGDRYLQEMLRSSLLEKLGTLASGQQAIDANIQKLML